MVTVEIVKKFVEAASLHENEKEEMKNKKDFVRRKQTWIRFIGGK